MIYHYWFGNNHSVLNKVEEHILNLMVLRIIVSITLEIGVRLIRMGLNLIKVLLPIAKPN